MVDGFLSRTRDGRKLFRAYTQGTLCRCNFCQVATKVITYVYTIQITIIPSVYLLQTFSRNIDLVYSSSANPQKLHSLKRRFANFCGFLDTKFKWRLVVENQEEDEDEGEYAPVIVDLGEDETKLMT
jgi:hypothetical protein